MFNWLFASLPRTNFNHSFNLPFNRLVQPPIFFSGEPLALQIRPISNRSANLPARALRPYPSSRDFYASLACASPVVAPLHSESAYPALMVAAGRREGGIGTGPTDERRRAGGRGGRRQEHICTTAARARPPARPPLPSRGGGVPPEWLSGAAAASAPLKSRFSDAQGMFHFSARISVASLHASRNGAFSLEDRWRKCRACRRWRRSRSVVRRAETDDVDGLTDGEGPPAGARTLTHTGIMS